MGFNVIKRVSDLRKQVDQNQVGRWHVVRATFLSFLGLSLLAIVILPAHREPAYEEVLKEDGSVDEMQTAVNAALASWRKLQRQFDEQMHTLESSPLVLIPGASGRYEDFGKALVASAKPKHVKPVEGEDPDFAGFTFAGIRQWFHELFVGLVLRTLFVLLAYWPLWILAAAGGFFFAQHRGKAKVLDTMLSVLDRKKGPFYSGIYGPLRPNNSFSGTDLSCPSLACPPEISRKDVLTHKLAALLKAYGAQNETTLGLLQIILAHRDFPGNVPEENPLQAATEDERDSVDQTDDELFNQKGYIVSTNGYSLEMATLEGLTAVLEAHKRIAHYRETLTQKNIKPAALNKNYPSHVQNVKKLCSGISPLGQLLAKTLTPNRMWALGQISPAVVATTYLAIEAGKSLVYKRHGDGFSQISNYPHLQARAVVQSVASYHHEYQGDTRLIIRQAIICSRRHGDFGRAFLPNRMPIESRALRDWLEILFAEPEKRQQAASLVELDTHIEEIGVNWRSGFVAQIKQFKKDTPAPELSAQASVRGLPFKSVVLMPVERVVQLSLRGIHAQRKVRITELLDETRSYQTQLNISARLPGFKRQAMEAERSGDDSDSILRAIATKANGSALIEEWRIVRRMLTRFNWLSTRVGDDGVPLAGLVQGVVANTPADNNAPKNSKNSTKFDSLVPLRQRRLAELFGKNWENTHYAGAPHPEQIEIFASQEALAEALARTVAKAGESAASETDGLDDELENDSAVKSAVSGGS